MNNALYPCIWFDGQAKAAADFYCAIFPDSSVRSDNGMVVNWELCGQKFMGLNGGPMFKPNPSISFFITCETNEEIDAIWKQLSVNASIMMALDKYDWSEYYGFLQDQFGVSWQIFKGRYSDVNQKITPCFLFTDSKFGKANEAVHFYTTVFQPSTIQGILMYSKEEMPQENIVKHSQFSLLENVFMAMDGPGDHQYGFNEGLSFVISCETQQEIDYYWEKFTTDGGEESRCGWCKDKFGVSWQVVPTVLGKLMSDPEKSQRVMAAFMKMNKFDIEGLMNA